MSSIVRVILILLAVIVVGGGVALAVIDIPAPTAKVEKVIPDDRLPR